MTQGSTSVQPCAILIEPDVPVYPHCGKGFIFYFFWIKVKFYIKILLNHLYNEWFNRLKPMFLLSISQTFWSCCEATKIVDCKRHFLLIEIIFILFFVKNLAMEIKTGFLILFYFGLKLLLKQIFQETFFSSPWLSRGIISPIRKYIP